MARHLVKVKNQNDLLNKLDSGYLENPYVALISGVTAPNYNSYSATPYENQYFTIGLPEGVSFAYVTCPSGVYYSKDRGATWMNGDMVFLFAGESAWVKGTSLTIGGSSHFSVPTGKIKVYGNVMSLQYGDNFTGATLDIDSAFSYLFSGCTNLLSVENLKLPSTTLTNSCYAGMFKGCTSLTTAPELPATTLAESCYDGMFQGCTSLTTPPQLPATTLAEKCYNWMFRDCTSLTVAPELPATTLATYCYGSMFRDCTSLTTAPELPATTLANNCYNYMFYGCSSCWRIICLATDISAMFSTLNWVNGVNSSGTFYKAPSMESWTTGISGIPDGWTVVDSE